MGGRSANLVVVLAYNESATITGVLECAPRRCRGIVELPMTLMGTPAGSVPFAGGVYFRVLPWLLVRRALRRHDGSGDVVLSYLHPYDIDGEQERFMHPGIRDSRVFNWLMYRGRGRVFPRLERVLEMGFTIDTYERYVRERLGGELAAWPPLSPSR